VAKFISVQIELTNHCNYSCRMCPHTDELLTREKGFMSFSLFEKLALECFEVSKEINYSFFGKQTLHPRFRDVMLFLEERPDGFGVVLNSNLSLITRAHFELFLKMKLDDLRVGIDASTPETYDILRPSGLCLDLDGVEVKNRDRFYAIEKKLEYWFRLKDHTPTRHVFTVNSINKHEIKAYIDRWKPLLGDEDRILVKSVITYGGKMRDSVMSENPCDVPTRYFPTVDWQGNVSPCNLDTNMDLMVGSAKETTLSEVVGSMMWKDMMEKIESKKIQPCKDCFDSNNRTKNKIFTRNTIWSDDFLKCWQ